MSRADEIAARIEARRARFEAAIREWNTDPKRGVFSLARFDYEIDGKLYARYRDPDTDNAWIGFQLAELGVARESKT